MLLLIVELRDLNKALTLGISDGKDLAEDKGFGKVVSETTSKEGR